MLKPFVIGSMSRSSTCIVLGVQPWEEPMYHRATGDEAMAAAIFAFDPFNDVLYEVRNRE